MTPEKPPASRARRPLKVPARNARYFTDGSGKAIYLTGSHTWANIQDIGFADLPPAFDYSAYLDFLQKHHHNFIRLRRWELSRWTERDVRVRYCAPHPWQRTGPGRLWTASPNST